MQNNSDREIWNWSVSEIVRAIGDKEVSCREVIQAHLDRIEEVNPKVNAVTVVLEDALARADAADKNSSRGVDVGPLHGVPFTVKENIDVAGSATTGGVRAMENARPETDAPLVAQLRNAGAIPIARTNMPDLGLRMHSVNALRGETVNPWDASRTPGGSSGGDAAAVATGMTPLGIGNDYGGSLRGPAQCCGVSSVRPSLGRVPDHMSLLPAELSITLQLWMVEGPIARRVEDLKMALACMSGPDPRDPWWSPCPLSGPPLKGPLKVAVTFDPAGMGVDPAVSEGVKKAADALASRGYVVEEVEPPLIQQLFDLWISLTSTEMRELTLPFVKSFVSADSLRALEYWVEAFPPLDLGGYMRGLADRKGIARAWALFQEEHPLILGPVLTMPPFKLNYDVRDMESFRETIISSRFNMAANVLGLPSVAQPVGTSEGLPQAVQVIGPRYREDLCFEAAQALEDTLGTLTPIDPRSQSMT